MAWSAWSRDQRITALFEQHYVELCRLARLLVDDPGSSEELVQEAFLKTFASWGRMRDPDKAFWYVRRAVVNLARSRLRRNKVERQGNAVVWQQQWAPAKGEWDPDRREQVLAVLEAVRALSPRQREIVVLRYYSDLLESDIASLLGCSIGTVKSQLARARHKLSDQLSSEWRQSEGPGR